MSSYLENKDHVNSVWRKRKEQRFSWRKKKRVNHDLEKQKGARFSKRRSGWKIDLPETAFCSFSNS